jgi:hypothetical protein
VGKFVLDASGSEQGPNAGSCEHGNESLNVGYFLTSSVTASQEGLWLHGVRSCYAVCACLPSNSLCISGQFQLQNVTVCVSVENGHPVYVLVSLFNETRH